MASFKAKSLLWLTVAALLFSFYLFLDARSGVSPAIGRLANDPDIKEFHLDQVTNFAWDQVLLFPPRMPRAKVCAFFEIPDKDCASAINVESKDDSQMTIAFVLGGCIRLYALHDRKNGNFQPLTKPRVIDARNARFVILHGTPWPKLVRKDSVKQASLH